MVTCVESMSLEMLPESRVSGRPSRFDLGDQILAELGPTLVDAHCVPDDPC
jgi:hypothetical protein